MKTTKTLTLAQIHEQTLSTEITTPNIVYKVLEPVLAKNFKKILSYELVTGNLICISGCGELNHSLGYSKFMIGKEWYTVPNQSVTHYANHILTEVK